MATSPSPFGLPDSRQPAQKRAREDDSSEEPASQERVIPSQERVVLVGERPERSILETGVKSTFFAQLFDVKEPAVYHAHIAAAVQDIFILLWIAKKDRNLNDMLEVVVYCFSLTHYSNNVKLFLCGCSLRYLSELCEIEKWTVRAAMQKIEKRIPHLKPSTVYNYMKYAELCLKCPIALEFENSSRLMSKAAEVLEQLTNPAFSSSERDRLMQRGNSIFYWRATPTDYLEGGTVGASRLDFRDNFKKIALSKTEMREELMKKITDHFQQLDRRHNGPEAVARAEAEARTLNRVKRSKELVKNVTLSAVPLALGVATKFASSYMGFE